MYGSKDKQSSIQYTLKSSLFFNGDFYGFRRVSSTSYVQFKSYSIRFNPHNFSWLWQQFVLSVVYELVEVRTD